MLGSSVHCHTRTVQLNEIRCFNTGWTVSDDSAAAVGAVYNAGQSTGDGRA